MELGRWGEESGLPVKERDLLQVSFTPTFGIPPELLLARGLEYFKMTFHLLNAGSHHNHLLGSLSKTGTAVLIVLETVRCYHVVVSIVWYSLLQQEE